ncbi:MAG: hypothetical protein J6Y62_04500 [Clostridia bacterium]|nr:hypothetical protein [Clostridia bacterium]
MEGAFGYFCVVLGLDLLLFLGWLFKVLVIKAELNDCIISLTVLHILSMMLTAAGILFLKP